MRKAFLLLLCLCSTISHAHTSLFQSVAARYKTIQSATAMVTKTINNGASSTGILNIRKPDLVSITTNGNQEKLIMQGNTFTMTYEGRDMQTDSRKNQQFTPNYSVLTSLINGGTTDISSLEDVKVEKRSNNIVITVTPPSGWFWRRGLFKSFVLVLNSQTSEFRSLSINMRNGTDMTYTFTDFKFKN